MGWPLDRRPMTALILAFACTEEPEAHFDDPESEGSFGVITEWHAFGDGRLQLWLPSSNADGDQEEYDDLLTGLARTEGTADCSQVRPVVVFSHGNGGIRWQSLFLTERLAAHGYVVVAPDHVGNTLFDLDDIPRAEVAATRPGDVSAAFDFAVEAVPDCVSAEEGYAVIGHSFGGWTALAVSGAQVDTDYLAVQCAEDWAWLCGLEEHLEGPVADLSDDRVWAALPITPVGAFTFGPGLASQHTPILVFGGELDDGTSMEEQVHPIFEGVGGTPKHLATVTGAGHFSFTEMCLLPGSFNGCGEGFTPTEIVHPVVNRATLAFLGRQRGYDVELPQDPLLAWE